MRVVLPVQPDAVPSRFAASTGVKPE
jgi:hypothetical protein